MTDDHESPQNSSKLTKNQPYITVQSTIALITGLLTACVYSLFLQHHYITELRSEISVLTQQVQQNVIQINNFKLGFKEVNDQVHLTTNQHTSLRHVLSEISEKIDGTSHTINLLKPLTNLARDNQERLSSETLATKISKIPDRTTQLEIMQGINLGNWRDLKHDFKTFSNRTDDNVIVLKESLKEVRKFSNSLETRLVVMSLQTSGEDVTKTDVNKIIADSFVAKDEWNTTMTQLKAAFQAIEDKIGLTGKSVSGNINYNSVSGNSMMSGGNLMNQQGSSGPQQSAQSSLSWTVNNGYSMNQEANTAPNLVNEDFGLTKELDTLKRRTSDIEAKVYRQSEFLQNLNGWTKNVNSILDKIQN